MILLRRLGFVALGIAFAHIVFGAIVRITDSGMGCGDNWPKCHGQWLPPLDRADLIIEISHRWLALVLLLAILALVGAAWRRRHLAGVGGRGGVLRAAIASAALWVAPAIFGAITVWLENPPSATVVHKVLAALLLAALATAVLRAGGLGASSPGRTPASDRTRRSAYAAAVLVLIVIALGGLTAKIPGAAQACQGFPLCNGQLIPEGGPQHVHMTHRILGIMLLLHMIGVVVGITRRKEGATIRRVGWIALGAVVAQIVVAAVMVETFLPNVVRSLHQAIGISIWLAVFTLAWLAHSATRRAPERVEQPVLPVPERRIDAVLTTQERAVGLTKGGAA
jgi:heme A synthase